MRANGYGGKPMTLQEATELREVVGMDRDIEFVRVHQIGNGDYVVILEGICYWLWSPDDWYAFRQREENAMLAPAGQRYKLAPQA